MFLFLQCPVLSLGEGLGSRVVLYEGASVFTGRYVIEEGEEEEEEGGGRIRRLVFLSNPGLAQTEVKVVSGKPRHFVSVLSFLYTSIKY